MRVSAFEAPTLCRCTNQHFLICVLTGGQRETDGNCCMCVLRFAVKFSVIRKSWENYGIDALRKLCLDVSGKKNFRKMTTSCDCGVFSNQGVFSCLASQWLCVYMYVRWLYDMVCVVRRRLAWFTALISVTWRRQTSTTFSAVTLRSCLLARRLNRSWSLLKAVKDREPSWLSRETALMTRRLSRKLTSVCVAYDLIWWMTVFDVRA